MKYKGIIFDMDGVIVDTNILHYHAWKAVADSLELSSYTYQDNEKERGAGRREGIKRIARESKKVISEQEIDRLEKIKNDVFFEKLNQTDISKLVFPDVVSTLIALKEKGVRIALGSSSKNAKLIMARAGLENMFDYICDGTMVSKAKPEPDIFINCMKGLNLSEREVLIVEDSLNGILAGKNADIDCAGKSNAKISEYTRYPIDNVSDILKIIE